MSINMKKEAISHPSHYLSDSGIEAIDAIEAWDLGKGFNRGNAVKYICRAGIKDPSKEIEDLEKAAWYINREIERLKKEALKNAPEPKYCCCEKSGECSC